MPYRIDAAAGSSAFINRFRELREHYISQIVDHIGDTSIQSCWLVSCDSDPEQWKGPNSFLDPSAYATDALDFLRGMIDQGHRVGCVGYSVDGQLEVWLGYWEDPYTEPVWPNRDSEQFRQIWDGVVRA